MRYAPTMGPDAHGSAVDARADELLALAADLERRDAAIARQIDEIADLAGRALAIREQGSRIGAELGAIPAELETLDRADFDAAEAERRARAELEEIEARLAALEGARRPRHEEIERARRTAQDAREAVADAEARVARLVGRRVELHDLERALEAEAEGAVVAAREVATQIAGVPRVSDTGKAPPGTTLAELDDWGGRARAALFVARGTLETERERIVAEAESLGASVLGDDLAGTSVALVRRRLEQALR